MLTMTAGQSDHNILEVRPYSIQYEPTLFRMPEPHSLLHCVCRSPPKIRWHGRASAHLRAPLRYAKRPRQTLPAELWPRLALLDGPTFQQPPIGYCSIPENVPGVVTASLWDSLRGIYHSASPIDSETMEGDNSINGVPTDGKTPSFPLNLTAPAISTETTDNCDKQLQDHVNRYCHIKHHKAQSIGTLPSTYSDLVKRHSTQTEVITYTDIIERAGAAAENSNRHTNASENIGDDDTETHEEGNSEDEDERERRLTPNQRSLKRQMDSYIDVSGKPVMNVACAGDSTLSTTEKALTFQTPIGQSFLMNIDRDVPENLRQLPIHESSSFTVSSSSSSPQTTTTTTTIPSEKPRSEYSNPCARIYQSSSNSSFSPAPADKPSMWYKPSDPSQSKKYFQVPTPISKSLGVPINVPVDADGRPLTETDNAERLTQVRNCTIKNINQAGDDSVRKTLEDGMPIDSGQSDKAFSAAVDTYKKRAKSRRVALNTSLRSVTEFIDLYKNCRNGFTDSIFADEFVNLDGSSDTKTIGGKNKPKLPMRPEEAAREINGIMKKISMSNSGIMNYENCIRGILERNMTVEDYRKTMSLISSEYSATVQIIGQTPLGRSSRAHSDSLESERHDIRQKLAAETGHTPVDPPRSSNVLICDDLEFYANLKRDVEQYRDRIQKILMIIEEMPTNFRALSRHQERIKESSENAALEGMSTLEDVSAVHLAEFLKEPIAELEPDGQIHPCFYTRYDYCRMQVDTTIDRSHGNHQLPGFLTPIEWRRFRETRIYPRHYPPLCLLCLRYFCSLVSQYLQTKNHAVVRAFTHHRVQVGYPCQYNINAVHQRARGACDGLIGNHRYYCSADYISDVERVTTESGKTITRRKLCERSSLFYIPGILNHIGVGSSDPYVQSTVKLREPLSTNSILANVYRTSRQQQLPTAVTSPSASTTTTISTSAGKPKLNQVTAAAMSNASAYNKHICNVGHVLPSYMLGNDDPTWILRERKRKEKVRSITENHVELTDGVRLMALSGSPHEFALCDFESALYYMRAVVTSMPVNRLPIGNTANYPGLRRLVDLDVQIPYTIGSGDQRKLDMTPEIVNDLIWGGASIEPVAISSGNVGKLNPPIKSDKRFTAIPSLRDHLILSTLLVMYAFVRTLLVTENEYDHASKHRDKLHTVCTAFHPSLAVLSQLDPLEMSDSSLVELRIDSLLPNPTAPYSYWYYVTKHPKNNTTTTTTTTTNNNSPFPAPIPEDTRVLYRKMALTFKDVLPRPPLNFAISDLRYVTYEVSPIYKRTPDEVVVGHYKTREAVLALLRSRRRGGDPNSSLTKDMLPVDIRKIFGNYALTVNWWRFDLKQQQRSDWIMNVVDRFSSLVPAECHEQIFSMVNSMSGKRSSDLFVCALLRVWISEQLHDFEDVNNSELRFNLAMIIQSHYDLMVYCLWNNRGDNAELTRVVNASCNVRMIDMLYPYSTRALNEGDLDDYFIAHEHVTYFTHILKSECTWTHRQFKQSRRCCSKRALARLLVLMSYPDNSSHYIGIVRELQISLFGMYRNCRCRPHTRNLLWIHLVFANAQHPEIKERLLAFQNPNETLVGTLLTESNFYFFSRTPLRDIYRTQYPRLLNYKFWLLADAIRLIFDTNGGKFTDISVTLEAVKLDCGGREVYRFKKYTFMTFLHGVLSNIMKDTREKSRVFPVAAEQLTRSETRLIEMYAMRLNAADDINWKQLAIFGLSEHAIDVLIEAENIYRMMSKITTKISNSISRTHMKDFYIIYHFVDCYITYASVRSVSINDKTYARCQSAGMMRRFSVDKYELLPPLERMLSIVQGARTINARFPKSVRSRAHGHREICQNCKSDEYYGFNKKARQFHKESAKIQSSIHRLEEQTHNIDAGLVVLTDKMREELAQRHKKLVSEILGHNKRGQKHPYGFVSACGFDLNHCIFETDALKPEIDHFYKPLMGNCPPSGKRSNGIVNSYWICPDPSCGNRTNYCQLNVTPLGFVDGGISEVGYRCGVNASERTFLDKFVSPLCSACGASPALTSDEKSRAVYVFDDVYFCSPTWVVLCPACFSKVYDFDDSVTQRSPILLSHMFTMIRNPASYRSFLSSYNTDVDVMMNSASKQATATKRRIRSRMTKLVNRGGTKKGQKKGRKRKRNPPSEIQDADGAIQVDDVNMMDVNEENDDIE